MKIQIFFLSIITVLVSSCSDATSVLPKASGRANEVLVVVDDPVWDGEAGNVLYDLLSQEVAGLAWQEPMFDISRVNHRNYSEMLQIARNLIYVDVSNKYTSAKIKLYRDLHASNQSFVKIQSPNLTELKATLEKNGNRILSYLYTTERDRTLKYFKKYKNIDIEQQIQDSIGVRMLIPAMFSRHKIRKDFAWMVAGNSDSKQYLALYSYPYTDENTFTKEFLIAKRNEVMKANIPGANEGSYMSTGTFYPPVYKPIDKNGVYCGELRGVWETVGDMMGGPFVSHSFLDSVHQKVITVEGFIYAPEQNKRNHMRQLEALIQSAHVPSIKAIANSEKQ